MLVHPPFHGRCSISLWFGRGVTAAVAVVLSGLLLSSVGIADDQTLPDIQVNGLMPNQAVITLNGKQRILRVGKASPEGLLLLSADSHKARFAWHDQQVERTVSKQIASQFSASEEKEEARIQRGHNDHFYTPGQINGQLVNFMVDTGAFAVAMSKDEADRLGIAWRTAPRFVTSTAGGNTAAHEVVLDSVTVGNITLYNIKAAVIVTQPMPEILLGMTFLGNTEMREENNTLVLRKKF